HGLARELLAAQAAATGVPIRFGAATWSGYREEFLRVVGEGIAATGARIGVFGDIDMDDHREWEEAVCAEVGATAALPLWHRDRRGVVDELLAAGFEAAGADACGENGEFHTFVVDGPTFSRRVEVTLGETSLRDGVWFVDLLPA